MPTAQVQVKWTHLLIVSLGVMATVSSVVVAVLDKRHANANANLVKAYDEIKVATKELEVEWQAARSQLTSDVRMSERLDKEVNTLKFDVSRLTTEEIVLHMRSLEERIKNISAQVTSLQQIISPNNASDILTVARMKEEIFARKEFENKVDDRVQEKFKENQDKFKENEVRLNRTDDKLDTIQQWIWGSLVTLIAALGGATLFLLRRFTHVVNSLSGDTQAQATASPAASTEPPRQAKKTRP